MQPPRVIRDYRELPACQRTPQNAAAYVVVSHEETDDSGRTVTVLVTGDDPQEVQRTATKIAAQARAKHKGKNYHRRFRNKERKDRGWA